MPTLGQILTDDLTSKLNDSGFLNDALEFTSDVFVESVKELSEQGFSADGSPWEDLGDSHAKRKDGDYTADLRFKFYSSSGAMDNIYTSIQGDIHLSSSLVTVKWMRICVLINMDCLQVALKCH